MLFDWSAACAEDDPFLVVPWHDDDSQRRFVDLRTDPFALDELAEAQAHPALSSALRSLNGPRSAVFTAKCDVWMADPEELAQLALALMVEADEARAGTLSYVDVLCRDRALFRSVHQQQHLLGRLERRLTPLELPFAEVEAVIRPALLDLDVPQEGFAVSLYCKAVGADAEAAYARWEEALAAVTSVLRSRDLFPQT